MSKTRLKKIEIGEVLSHCEAFENDVNQADFVRFFGATIGSHLWSNFTRYYDSSVTTMLRHADSETKSGILSFVSQWERKE